MSRRQDRSELPQFNSYDQDVLADATPVMPQQAASGPESYDEDFAMGAVTTPEALDAAKRAALVAMQRQASAQQDLYRKILTPPYGGYGQPGLPGQRQLGRSPQQIESAYRDAIAGRPTPRAIGAAPARLQSSKAAPKLPPAHPNTAQSGAIQTAVISESKPKTLLERMREKPLQWGGGILLAGSILYLGGRASMSDGATAAVLNAQAVSKELKNDSFACPTPMAQIKFNTGPNMEVHVPVKLKASGHENSYVNIPLGQLQVLMILNACGVTDPTKGSRIWAKRDGDNQYTIDRSALKLSIDPWATTFNNKGALNEDQARDGIARSILPAPGKGLTLMVDGKPASPKDYPLADNAPAIVLPGANSNTADVYSPIFVEELIDKLQDKTIQTLENPDFCSSVLPTVDAANIAALRQQKNLDAKMPVIINGKTAYGKASTEFESEKVTVRKNPVWKSGLIKEVVNSPVVEIENFNMSCAAIAYTQAKTAAAPPPAKPKTTATTPATKK